MGRDVVKEMATEDFIDDVRTFSEQSMLWCSEQSMKATVSVGDILNVLLADAKRIAKMSETTLEAIQALRAKIGGAMNSGNTAGLIENLKVLCNEHVEVSEFINPVVETLQFQDRISQNMNNIGRMLAAWAEMRTELKSSNLGNWDAAQKLAFGKALLECTTMKEERDVIRSVIPDLPVEEEADGLQLF